MHVTRYRAKHAARIAHPQLEDTEGGRGGWGGGLMLSVQQFQNFGDELIPPSFP